jgi:hypothetical protein
VPERTADWLIDLSSEERKRRFEDLRRHLEERDRWRKTATPEELEEDQRERDEWWERFRLEKPELAAQLDSIRQRLEQVNRGESSDEP